MTENGIPTEAEYEALRHELLNTVQVIRLADYLEGFEAGVRSCNERCAQLEAEIGRLLEDEDAEKKRYWREYNDRTDLPRLRG